MFTGEAEKVWIILNVLFLASVNAKCHCTSHPIKFLSAAGHDSAVLSLTRKQEANEENEKMQKQSDFSDKR